MRPALNLANKKFGRLTAIDIAYKKNRQNYWNCTCECGSTTIVRASALKNKKILSCGCYLKERYIETHRKYFGGEKVDKLTILEYDAKVKKYKCQCDCGKVIYKDIATLKTLGAKYGCGCFLRSDPNEYVGKRFGRLTVLSPAFYNKKWFFNCKCDCGNIKVINIDAMKYKTTTSCGCYARESAGKATKKHGMTRTRIYKTWGSLKSRCYNKNDAKYPNYGARGIRVCEDWLNHESGFINFMNWAYKNGYKDNLTIDRINVNGNYEPCNCRWVTNKVQANNKTTNKRVMYKGEVKTVAEWADVLGVNYNLVVRRIKRGWDVETAFTTPSRLRNKKDTEVK